jgi:hypothetical protein
MGRARELAELATAYDSGTGFSFRNRIINGDMRIDRRNAGAAVTVSGAASQNFSTDRWIIYVDGGSATGQRVADGPAGFTNSLRFTVTSTSTGPALVQQRLEGLNAADLAWGTPSALPVTLSFWVKASITGTFGISISNWSGTRATRTVTYTISAANTWEYKTITIPGSTAGTWATDNTQHAQIRWTLSPTSSPFAPGSWHVGDALGVTGQTNLMATNGATFQITGAQFEAGSVATPFEHRPIGAELLLCQRYLPVIEGSVGYPLVGIGTNVARGTINLPVSTRVPGTGITTNAMSNFSVTNIGSPTSIAFYTANSDSLAVDVSASSGVTANGGYFLAGGTARILVTGCEL